MLTLYDDTCLVRSRIGSMGRKFITSKLRERERERERKRKRKRKRECVCVCVHVNDS